MYLMRRYDVGLSRPNRQTKVHADPKNHAIAGHICVWRSPTPLFKFEARRFQCIDPMQSSFE